MSAEPFMSEALRPEAAVGAKVWTGRREGTRRTYVIGGRS